MSGIRPHFRSVYVPPSELTCRFDAVVVLVGTIYDVEKSDRNDTVGLGGEAHRAPTIGFSEIPLAMCLIVILLTLFWATRWISSRREHLLRTEMRHQRS